MQVAAGYGDTWVTVGDRTRRAPVSGERAIDDVTKQMALLDEACGRVGRDPETIDRLVLTGPVLDSGLTSPERFAEVAAAYAAIGVTDLVVHWPRESEPFAADLADFEGIFEP
ncbi:MAG: hypothetical protein ACRD07_01445 [Acidimicrobiales bacterium]